MHTANIFYLNPISPISEHEITFGTGARQRTLFWETLLGVGTRGDISAQPETATHSAAGASGAAGSPAETPLAPLAPKPRCKVTRAFI